ncbi:MAG: hypothetical protein H7245_12985 [Candidatus Saccharibacteria bacterium]|nr:hypothetical protein [Pseudorhodobacter sp.]
MELWLGAADRCYFVVRNGQRVGVMNVPELVRAIGPLRQIKEALHEGVTCPDQIAASFDPDSRRKPA